MGDFFVRSSSAVIFSLGEKHIIGYGSMQESFTEEVYNSIYELLKYVSEPKKKEEIIDFIKKKNISEEIFELCLSKKYITDNPWVILNDKDSVDYKNRLYVDCSYAKSETILERIRDSILINIGCGGIGNYLMYAYASFLPKKIIMIDGDVVSESNLNRQIFFDLSDVNRLKCDVLKEKLEKRFKMVQYEAYSRFADANVLREILDKVKGEDIIVTISGDSNTTVRECTRIAAEYGIPCLNIGYLNDFSVIGPFYIPNYSACPFCVDLGADYEDNGFSELEEFNSFYRAPSSFMNSSMASAMAMTDILHYFSGEKTAINSLNKRIGIGNKDFNVVTIEVKRNEKCKICGSIGT